MTRTRPKVPESKTDAAEARPPFVEPEISEPKSLVGSPDALILQTASGGTIDGGAGPIDGGLDAA